MDIILDIIEKEKYKRKLTNYRLAKISNVSESTLCLLFAGKRKLGNSVKKRLLHSLGIDLELQKKQRAIKRMRIKGNYFRIFNDFRSLNFGELEKEQYTDELKEYCTERNYTYENTTYTNSVRSAFYCYLAELVKDDNQADTNDICKPHDFPEFSFDMYQVESFDNDNNLIYTDCVTLQQTYETILLQFGDTIHKDVKNLINSKLNKLVQLPF